MSEARLGPIAGLHPAVLMGDGRWEQVIASLRRSGTKRDAALADRIDAEVQEMRRAATPHTQEAQP